MKSPISHNLSIVAYFLSQYNDNALSALGYNTWVEAFSGIGELIHKKDNYLKLRRDEFDVLTDSPRVGWRNRPVASDVQRYFDVLQNESFDTLTGVVEKILGAPNNRYEIDGLDPVRSANIDDADIVNIDADDDTYLQQVNEITKEPKSKKYCSKPKILDASGAVTRQTISINRDAIVAKQALYNANYKCEISSSHNTFIRRKDNTPYTEPHHLIPMYMQGKLKTSAGDVIDLDVENNIVSLCSNCHNKLHYGKDIATDLKKLYDARKELLLQIGIDISFDDLLGYYSLY